MPEENPLQKEDMLSAFLKQSGIDPNSESQKEHPLEDSSDDLKVKTEALKMIKDPSESVRNNSQFPSKLKFGDLNEFPEEHPKMRGYDHSLEINRWKEIGGDYDPIEMGDWGSEID